MHCISHRYSHSPRTTRSSASDPPRLPASPGAVRLRARRLATGSGDLGAASSGMPRSRSRSKPPRRASSSTRAAGSPCREPPRSGDRLAGDRRVEPQRRRQRQGVQRAVRQAVAAAERPGRERGRERASSRRARSCMTAPRRSCSVPPDRGRRRRAAATRRSALRPRAHRVALGRPLADVERLRAVRECVQRRADRLGDGSPSVSCGS